MENELWTKYLDGAVAQIRDKNIKAEVREELLDHLEDRKERFLRFGSNEDEAQKKAIEIMGSRQELADKLGELHSFSPDDAFRHIVNVICFGLFCALMPFQTLIWQYTAAPVGVICVFYGMLRLRKANSFLRNGFIMSIIYTLYNFFMYIVMATELWAKEDFAMYFTVADFVLLFILCAFLCSGLSELLGEGKTDREKKLISRDRASNAALVGFFFLHCLSFFLFFAFMPFTQAILLGAIIHQLLSLRAHIELLDLTPDVKKMNFKRGWSVAVCVILTLAVPLTSTYIASTPEPEYKEHIKNDVAGANKNDMQAIRDKMISLGFPEVVANDLPDSEIQRYRNVSSVYYDKEARWVNGDKFMGKEPIEIYFITAKFPDDDYIVRTTFYFRWTKPQNGYRDSFKIETSDNNIILNDRVSSIRILYDENGKTYSCEPLNIVPWTQNIGKDHYPYGFEYRVNGKENLRGYLAVDMSCPKDFSAHVISVYYHQKYFANFPYSHPALYEDTFDNLNKLGFYTGGELFARDQFTTYTPGAYKPEEAE